MLDTNDPVDMNKVLDATERGQQTSDGMGLDLSPLNDTSEYPWERMPGEPNDWFDRFFKFYLKQNGKRSISEACRRHKTEDGFTGSLSNVHVGSNWRLNAYTWNWEVRAEAYDEHARMLDHIKWEARRATLREEEWDVSSELLEIAKFHFQKIKSSQVQPADPESNSGRVQLTRVAVKNQDAARFADLGSKLGRLATGMATEQIAINIQVRMEEVRKKRWDSALPQLQQVLDTNMVDGEFVEDEAVNEPPESET
jgi:hypothetical protein